MKSTCTTKEKLRLVQMECKWCDEFKRENLKHKLYMTCKFWEEAPLHSLQYILWLYARVTSRWCFLSRVPKLGLLLSWNFGSTYLSLKKVILEHEMAISHSPQKNLSNGVLHFPIGGHLTPFLTGFVVESPIPNLTPNPSFDHNSYI